MTRVRFLRDYENHVSGEVYDVGRAHHVDTLIRQGIAVYEAPGAKEGVFSVGEDGDVNGPTAGDVTNNFILQADNTWVDPTGVGHTGTTGSIFFAGAGGADSAPTENNTTFFIDNTDPAEPLIGFGLNTPSATLHIKRPIALEADSVLRVERDGTVAATSVLYVGDGGADPDLLVTGDGRVGVGIDQSTLNAKFVVKSTETIAVRIDSNGTGSSQALIITSDGVSGDAVDIEANSLEGAIALEVQADALTSGALGHFTSGSTSVVARDLVRIRNTSTAATNAVPIALENLATDAAAQFASFRSGFGAANAVFEWFRNGVMKLLPIADGSETDVAPADDHTLKKLSLQKLAAPPTNGAYLAFSNSPGETFYFVLEEG